MELAVSEKSQQCSPWRREEGEKGDQSIVGTMSYSPKEGEISLLEIMNSEAQSKNQDGSWLIMRLQNMKSHKYKS